MLPLVAAAVYAGVKIVGGLIGEGKAKKMERNLHRPDYETPDQDWDTYRLAESQAASGLSDNSKQLYEQNAERGATSSMNAILAAGGNVNNIASLYGNYDDGFNRLSLIDEDVRKQNQNRYYERSDKIADDMDKEWQVNKYAPWADAKQAIAAKYEKSAANVSSGFALLTNVAGRALGGNQFAGRKDSKSVTNAVTASDQSGSSNSTSVQSTYPGIQGGYWGIQRTDNPN